MGISPLLFFKFTSAPNLMSSSTLSYSFFSAAKCSGVFPCLFLTLISGFNANNIFKISKLSVFADM